jgi:GNAT superfamily N-acetyltransferase
MFSCPEQNFDELSIREFNDKDYIKLLGLHNSIYPDLMQTVEERRHEDSIGFSKASLHRWVAEIDGKLVAACQFQNDIWDFHPNSFDISIEVMPHCQGLGIGALLYDFLIDRIMFLKAIRVSSWFRDDDLKNATFLKKRGFRETHREAFSRLDLQEWIYDSSLDRTKELEGIGIRIMDLEQFKAYGDWIERLYELDRSVSLDVPGVTSVPELDVWQEEVFGSKDLIPKGYFVAVKDGLVIGTSNLFWRKASDLLEIGLTAVRRDYRRMGIATTLKLRAMSFAKRLGPRYLITSNEENNEAILSINRRLGFKRMPDWVKLEKDLT